MPTSEEQTLWLRRMSIRVLPGICARRSLRSTVRMLDAIITSHCLSSSESEGNVVGGLIGGTYYQYLYVGGIVGG